MNGNLDFTWARWIQLWKEVNENVNQSNRRSKNYCDIFPEWSFCSGILESTHSPCLIIVSIFLKFRVTLTKNWLSDIVWLLLEICIWIGKVTRFFWSEVSCKINFLNTYLYTGDVQKVTVTSFLSLVSLGKWKFY